MTRRTFVGHPSLMACAAFALCAVLFPSVSRGFAVQGLQVRTDGAGAYGSSVPAGNRLYYHRLRNRWYSPELGRFLSRDPVGFSGGPNLYAYVGNNPTSYRDPRGLFGQGFVTAGFGALIGAAIGGYRGGWQGAGQGLLTGAVGGFVAGETFGLVNPVAVGLLGEGTAAAATAGAASGAAQGFVATALDVAREPGAIAGPCPTVGSRQSIGERLAIGTAVGAALGGVLSGALSEILAAPETGSGGGSGGGGDGVGVGGSGGGGEGGDIGGSLSGAPSNDTGFLGGRGFQLQNPEYQPIRNAPGSVRDIEFSGHALDQMQNRGIVPAVVENTIQTAPTLPGRYPGTVYNYDPVNNVSVIRNSETGNVVTVFYGRGGLGN